MGLIGLHKYLRVVSLGVVGAVLLIACAWPVLAATQTDEPGTFSLQVTPSPIVETVQPGKPKTIELKIRNNGDKTELLKIVPRTFSFKGDSSNVSLSESELPETASWITFSDPTFTIKSGEWFTQRITVKPPEKSGFSYSFALVISRVNGTKPSGGTPALQGSVAVFTLLNIDRPGATRSLQINSFKTSKNIYEYLPVDFAISLQNTGNTIVQPYGNIYIQRTSSSNKPIAIIPVNEAKGYILPDSTRTLSGSWSEGFPAYSTTKVADNAQAKQTLVWDWGNAKNFRMGRYVAKAVAVYNDGKRDVPLEAEVSFWVIPWKLLLVATILGVLVIIGFVTVIKKASKIPRHKNKNHARTEKSD